MTSSPPVSPASKFTILNNGNLQLNNYTATNGVLYTNSSGVLQQATTGSSNLCLLSGATPTWGACDTGNTSWVQANGTIYPGISTEDLLVGGTSTASAKFAFINSAANTPTASISANSGNIATYLTGNGTLGGNQSPDAHHWKFCQRQYYRQCPDQSKRDRICRYWHLSTGKYLGYQRNIPCLRGGDSWDVEWLDCY